MKRFNLMSLFVLLFGFSTLLFAAEGSITISSPADGAKVKANVEGKMDYEVSPGPAGDHVHIYVDGKEEVVRSLKGAYKLPKFAPGSHTITIKIVTKGHTPTGVEKTVKVTAE